MVQDLVAVIFIGFGIWTFISPKSAIDFKISLLKSIGVKLQITVPTKSYRTLKYIGLGLAIVGFLIYFK